GRRYRGGDTPQSGPTGETISIDWSGVRPMRPNPRTSDHATGTAIRRAQEQFNESYCELLRTLDQAFNGNPHTLRNATGSMYRLQAQAQNGDGDADRGWDHDRRTDVRIRPWQQRSSTITLDGDGIDRRIRRVHRGSYLFHAALCSSTPSLYWRRTEAARYP